MNLEIPEKKENVEEIEASIEASRIVKEYLDRLKHYPVAETEKILIEEEKRGKKYSEKLKLLIPFKVASIVRDKGNYKKFENIRRDHHSTVETEKPMNSGDALNRWETLNDK